MVCRSLLCLSCLPLTLPMQISSPDCTLWSSANLHLQVQKLYKDIKLTTPSTTRYLSFAWRSHGQKKSRPICWDKSAAANCIMTVRMVSMTESEGSYLLNWQKQELPDGLGENILFQRWRGNRTWGKAGKNVEWIPKGVAVIYRRYSKSYNNVHMHSRAAGWPLRSAWRRDAGTFPISCVIPVKWQVRNKNQLGRYHSL